MANPTTTPIMTPATGPGNPLANPLYLVDQYGNPFNTANVARVGRNRICECMGGHAIALECRCSGGRWHNRNQGCSRLTLYHSYHGCRDRVITDIRQRIGRKRQNYRHIARNHSRWRRHQHLWRGGQWHDRAWSNRDARIYRVLQLGAQHGTDPLWLRCSRRDAHDCL
jgi:hypothetical protein